MSAFDSVEYMPPSVAMVIETNAAPSSSHSTATTNLSKTKEVIYHVATDSTSGSQAALGPLQMNYAGKTALVRLVDGSAAQSTYQSDHEDADTFNQAVDGNASGGSTSSKGGAYANTDIAEQVLAESTIAVTYAVDFASAQTGTTVFTPDVVTIDLLPATADYIVPNSLRMTWMGHVFEDYDGVIVRDRTPSDPGYVAGQLDYSSGIARIYDYVVSGSPSALSIDSLWTMRQNWTTASVFLRTAAAPIKPTGFVMNVADTMGNALVVNGDLDGKLTGLHVDGKIDYETGVVELQFGDYVLDTSLTADQKLEWWYSADDVGAVQPLKIWRPWPVDPSTLRYNTVSYFYLPLDADLLGIDPVRLPQDGRVPIFRPGGFVVIGNDKQLTTTPNNGQTINFGRVRISRVRVVGANGQVIENGYTVNREAGTMYVADVTGWSMPVTIQNRVEDLVRLADVQITGRLGITRQLTHAYESGESYASSALMLNDLKARVSVLFDQQTWSGAWSDSVIGAIADASYNDALSPIEVTNKGAITERWRLQFTSSTAYNLIGEHVGQIITGQSIVNDCAPINPATGVPYLTIRALGFGSGWTQGQLIRINTVGAIKGVWAVRTVQMGAETVLDDSWTLLVRADVDRP